MTMAANGVQDAEICATLDLLDNLSTAISALRDLLIPGEDLHNVSRSDLSWLMSVVEGWRIGSYAGARECADHESMASSAMCAITDLITPASDLNIVSRDHLCALVDVLCHLHIDASARMRAAIYPHVPVRPVLTEVRTA